jgi:hypothetical protein
MITNDTELNLYRVTSMGDEVHYIIAENFMGLAENLKIAEIEPDKVEVVDICYLSQGLINLINNK